MHDVMYFSYIRNDFSVWISVEPLKTFCHMFRESFAFSCTLGYEMGLNTVCCLLFFKKLYRKAIKRKKILATFRHNRTLLNEARAYLYAAFVEICLCFTVRPLIFLIGVKWCNLYAKPHIFSTELHFW